MDGVVTTRRCTVVIASTRAAAGAYEDKTGPVITAWLAERGWSSDLVVVADGEPVRDALVTALAQQPDLVLTSGGTGISPTDRTPEITRSLLDVEIAGIPEELRRRSAPALPTAVLTRGVAGVAGRTIVVNLPGSAGGVHDGLALLEDILEHMLSQLDDGDHAR